ncbi:MAG TPA: transglycosylase SLT domain-containing protein [Spirochaetota bacterium]|nr:transglycosylase SLT domain-containing protein [Spirochaetota bacterium]HPR49207.1 transglycosylase SLT domain-containing protein [Spirochaetota bacterium]
MNFRTILALLFFFLFTCTEAPTEGNHLAQLGFYAGSEQVYEELSAKKKTCYEYFVLAQTCKEKKLYKEAIFNFANSCFASYSTDKLTLYASPVYRFIKGFHVKSPLYDEAVFEIAGIFMQYREYPYVIKFCDSISQDLPGLWYESRLLKALSLAETGKAGQSFDVYSELLKEYNQAPQQQLVYIKMASLSEKMEKYDAALEQYYQAVMLCPESWEAQLAGKRIVFVSKKKNLPINSLFLSKTGKSLYHAGEYQNALTLLTDQNLPAEDKDESLMYIIRCLVRLNKESQTVPLIEKRSTDKKILTSLLMIKADELWDAGKRNSAAAVYNEIISTGIEPYKQQALGRIALFLSEKKAQNYKSLLIKYNSTYTDPTGELCLWSLAKEALAINNFVSTAEYLEESLKKYPQGSNSDRCRFWLYKISVKRNDKDVAAALFMEMILNNPDSSYTWQLIQDEIRAMNPADLKRHFDEAAARGRTEEARYYHSLLYALEKDRAARNERLKALGDSAEPYSLIEKKIASLELSTDNRDSLLQFDTIFKTGNLNALTRELRFLSDDEDGKSDTYYALAHYARKFGHYFVGVNAVQELLKLRGLKENIFLSPMALSEELYPRGFPDCVEKYSLENNLEKNYIYAVIKAESNFNHTAVSPAGAVGLMQLMPPTAGDVARKLKVADYDLKDPCTSIRFGSNYLAWLMRFFNNNICYAIGGYNAGAGNILKWKKSIPSDDEHLFIELVPFDETRGYMFRTARFFEQYTILYGK